MIDYSTIHSFIHAFIHSFETLLESYGESEVDDSRRTFLRNILKGWNSQTLNMVPKEATPALAPHVVFKFQSIGGIEGIYI